MNKIVRLKKKVAVVLLNYNNFKDSEECINSLLKVKSKPFSIIFVDNNSLDGSGEKIKRKFCEKITYIQSSQNGGFSKGNNIGIRHCLENNFDYILLLNNDTVVADDFLDPLIDSFAHQDVGIVTGKAYFYSKPNVLHMCGGEIQTIKITYSRYGAGEKDEGQFDMSRYVGFASCYFMMVDSTVFRDVGLLNENFFGGTEETEFNHRILKKGYKVFYNHNSKIWHKIGGSFKPGNIRSYFMANANKYIFAREVFSQPYYFIWFLSYSLYLIFIGTPLRIIRLIMSNGDYSLVSNYKAVFFAIIHGLSKKEFTLSDYQRFK